jgi:hypothetical protein
MRNAKNGSQAGNDPSNSETKKWVIVLIAFDEPDMTPQVIKECIAADENEKLAAFLRGGELLDVLWENDESVVEGYRQQVEKKCLR